MPGLGNTPAGTLTYNGIDLAGGADDIAPSHIKLVGAAVYDQSGRHVIWTDYHLSVETTIWANSKSDADAKVLQFRDLLGTAGRALVIDDLGTGRFNIPAGDGLNRGPKPRVVSVENVAGYLAIAITWECDFSVSALTDSPQEIAEFNYEAAYSIGNEGLTTRVVTGYLRVANDAKNTADTHREKLRIVLPNNFRRTRSEYAESLDKMMLRFNIVDEEQGGDPYPPGISYASGAMDWQSANRGFNKWAFSLNASLTVAPGYPKSLAGKKFFELLVDRRSKLKSANPNATVIPTSFRMSPGMWDNARTTSFAVQFTVVRCLKDILASALWAPLPDSFDWSKWQKSMDHLIGDKAVRGYAGLKPTKQNNVIINVGAQPKSIEIVDEAKKSKLTSEQLREVLESELSPANSYLGYKTRVRKTNLQNLSVLRKSVSVVVKAATGGSLLSVVGASLASSDKLDHIIEYHGTPHSRILIEGMGLRLGSPPVMATLESHGALTFTEIDSVDEVTHLGNMFTHALYQRRWWILYDVSGDITKYTQPPPKPQGLCD